MKNYLIASGLILSICFAPIYAQEYEWAKATGGLLADEGKSVTVDNLGNTYTVGYFRDVADFDPGIGVFELTSSGGKDVFIQKLDIDGNFLWAKSVGGSGSDVANGVAVDNAGNVFLTGGFYNTVDFDPGSGTDDHTSVGGEDYFILKLDANGNHQWAHTFGSIGSESGRGIATDSQGNVCAAGRFYTTVDFDPGTGTNNVTAQGGGDVFIHKFNSQGDFVWVNTLGGAGASSYAYDIAIDNFGNVYTTGRFSGTVDFDPGVGIDESSAVDLNDVYIHKTDANGNYLWAKTFGGYLDDLAYAISPDHSGNVYTTGYFHNSVDFDPGAGVTSIAANGDRDVFVHKLDANGDFIWVRTFGGTFTDQGLGLDVDTANNVYTVGSFVGSVDFDPGPDTTQFTAVNNIDLFLHKLTPSGDFEWAKTIGGNSVDYAFDVAVDSSNTIYTTGFFLETVDFDPGTSVEQLSAVGDRDFYVLKMTQCSPTVGIDVVNACFEYTWIDGITYTSDNNSASFILQNSSGCDSTVTLNLTITTIDVSTSINGNELSANDVNADSYQWIDCNSNQPISGATNYNYIPSGGGDYAVIISKGICSDTSECINSTLSIDHQFGSEVKLFPNPSNGLLTLISSLHTGIITVTDASGRLVMRKEVLEENTLLNLTDIENGVYMIQFVTGEHTYSFRVVLDK